MRCHLFVRLRSQRTRPNKICSAEEEEEEGEGALFVREVIFDTLMNSFK